MADNVVINPGNGGATIATDDVGGVQVQRVKVGFGTDGSLTDVTTATPMPVDNMAGEWRDEMAVLPGADGSGWQAPTTQGSVLWSLDGNAAGARYLKVTLDPRDPSARFDMIGLVGRAVQAPFRQGWGVTLSRRSAYQHIWFGQVGLDATGTPPVDSTPATLTITGGVVIATNVATITTTTPHGLVPGARVVLSGITDPRFNALVTVLAIPSTTQFQYAYTFANGTYGGAGTATPVDAALGYRDALGLIASDATSGNVTAVSRAESLAAWSTAWNAGSTWDASVVPNNVVNYSQPYTYPHQSRQTIETVHEKDWAGWSIHSIDTSNGVSSQTFRDQLLPWPVGGFLPRLQARNLPHLAVPVGPITAASKAGSTTATLTMPNHGLTTADFVVVYGIRDQTNFANQTGSVPIASVIDANRVTVAFGISATASSYGGVAYRASQNTVPSGLATSAIQQIGTSSTGRLQVVFAASQGTFTIGESLCVIGLVDSAGNPLSQYEGIYRVANTNTTTFQMELDPMQGQALPSTTTVGGTVLAATDVRIHFVRTQAHQRVGVEIESSRSHSRVISAVPVNHQGTVLTNVSQVGSSTASTIVGAQGTTRLLGVSFGIGNINTDKASAAQAVSGNSGTIADDFGSVISGIVNVTAVTGTNPVMDLVLRESYDGGTTWQDVYALPRITATGTYQIPPITLFGRRRFDWAIAGTTPSFTFAITTTRLNVTPQMLRQIFDRTLAPNTTGSSGTSLYVDQCSKYGLIVNSGAGASVNPVYGVQLSADGANWTDAGISLTVPPSSTIGASLSTPWPARYARAYVKTGGTGASHNYAALTATT